MNRTNAILLASFKELKMKMEFKLLPLKLHLGNFIQFRIRRQRAPFSVLRHTLAMHAIKNISFRNFRIRVVNVKNKIKTPDRNIAWKEIMENQSRLLHWEIERFWAEERNDIKNDIIKKWKRTNL